MDRSDCDGDTKSVTSENPGLEFSPSQTVLPDDFKRGMRRLASGVAIVATTYQGKRFGLAATAVSSVSADPATLMVCVNRSASAHEAISQSGHFTVNLLHEAEKGIVELFSVPHSRDLRFLSREWRSLVTGAPALVGSLASLDCRLIESVPVSSHTIFLGEVVALTINDDVKPLLYWNGCYFSLSNPQE